MWCTTFQSEEWLVAAERQGLNPVLVGYDPEYCYDISRTTKGNERFLVLRPGDTSGDFTLYNQEMSGLFSSCLQPYEFDKARAEICLRDGPVVHVGAVFDDPEMLKLPNVTRLFDVGAPNPVLPPQRATRMPLDCGLPKSRYLFWRHSKEVLGHLGYDEIRGVNGKVKILRQVRFACCLILSQSCIDHPSAYYFHHKMISGFGIFKCIGSDGSDGWWLGNPGFM